MKSKANDSFSFKTTVQFLAVLIPLTVIGWFGCSKPGSNAPVNPSLGQNLSLTLQTSGRARAQLLGAASNLIFYSVTGQGMSPVTGMVGPVTTTGSSGTVNLSLLVPQGSARLMAFEIADGATTQALAIGAVQADINEQGTNQTVEMGSLVRNCYNQRATIFPAGCYFNFQSENLADATTVGSPAGYDIDFLPNGGTYQMDADNGNTLVYMGNNNLINDAMAPSSGYVANSVIAKTNAGASITDPQVGDVFCVKFSSGGFAWVYVTDMGQGPEVSSPSFEFRMNSSLNYYGYQQTIGDQSGPCPSPVPTNTPSPTPTPCPLC